MPPKDRASAWKKEGRNQLELDTATGVEPHGVRGSVTGRISPLQGRYKVELFDGKGIKTHTQIVGNPEGLNGDVTKRGKIGGFSRKSKRAMREFLLTRRVGQEFGLYSSTLTVPGPLLTTDEEKRLHSYFTDRLLKARIPTIWRKEITLRKQIHYHCLHGGDLQSPVTSYLLEDDYCRDVIDVSQTIPDRKGGKPRGLGKARTIELMKAGKLQPLLEVRRHWLGALDALGPCDYRNHEGIKRSVIPGANVIAVQADNCDDKEIGWMRYLQDHATKSKRDQEAIGHGKHWGVVCRKEFLRVLPDHIEELTAYEYRRFLRALQRLATPWVRDDRAPFGTRLGFRNRRGKIGSAIWYRSPGTIRRLMEWAKEYERDNQDRLYAAH